jgi:hypothetical protein
MPNIRIALGFFIRGYDLLTEFLKSEVGDE